MAITNVQQWIKDGKRYKEGVELFRSLSSNEALIELFESDDDDYNRDRLLIELQTLDKATEVKIGPHDHVAFTSISTPKVEKWDTIHFPEELKQSVVRVGELTKKIDHHRAQLELIPTDKERYESAKIIVLSVRERAKILQEIDEFQKTGKAPEPEVVKPPVNKPSNVELFRQYKNLHSRISKANKKGDIEKVKELTEEREKIKQILDL